MCVYIYTYTYMYKYMYLFNPTFAILLDLRVAAGGVLLTRGSRRFDYRKLAGRIT